MADNLTTTTTVSTVPSGSVIATDDVAGIHYQRVKLVDGAAEGTAAIGGDAANGLDVDVTRLPALVAGSANIGDVDVLTVPAPLSTTGGGVEATALRVTLASDSTGLVSVDDNGGSLTVDAASLPLPTGASTLAEQQTQTTALQLIDDAAHADDAVRGKSLLIGAVLDDTATVAVTENQAGYVRMSSARRLLVDPSGVTSPISAASLPLPAGAATLAGQTQPGVDIGDVTVNNASGASAVNVQDGGNSLTVDGTVSISGALDTELPAAAALADAAANPTTPTVGSANLVFNGTTWDRARGDTTNGIDVDVTRLPALVAGSANIGDVDVLTIAAGDNNIGNVDIVTLPALVTGSAVIGRVGHDTTGFGNGRKIVTTAGTRVTLAGTTAAKWVVITAETDNTGIVVVGTAAGVIAAIATREGIPLNASDSITLPCDDLAEVGLDSMVSGDGVTFMYGT